MEVLKIEDTGDENVAFKIEMKWMQKSQIKVLHRELLCGFHSQSEIATSQLQ